jgi:hypothetical protein
MVITPTSPVEYVGGTPCGVFHSIEIHCEGSNVLSYLNFRTFNIGVGI